MQIPEIPLEDFEIPEELEDPKEDLFDGSINFGFLGIGQAGGRIVKAFYDLGYRRILALNTSKADLEPLDIPSEHKLFISTGGKDGAGKNMSLGAQAVINNKEEIFDKIKDIFGVKVDHVMLCMGCGGGTGAGGVFPAKEITSEYLKKIVGVESTDNKIGMIAALPKEGEKDTVVRQNLNLLYSRFEKNEFSPLLLVDNAKITKLYRGITPALFWPTVNTSIAGVFHVFNVLSKVSSNYTSFDSADYYNIITTPGIMSMGVTNIKEYKKDTDISRALRVNLFKTLLTENVKYSDAKISAVVTIAGKKIMETVTGLLESIDYGVQSITQMCSNCIIHQGIYQDEVEKLRVYTVVGGMGLPNKL